MTDQSTTELSERELEILRLVATGAGNKEIAQKLVISPNTVKVHLRNIFAKIGVTSRTEAAMYAVHAGLVVNQALLENDTFKTNTQSRLVLEQEEGNSFENIDSLVTNKAVNAKQTRVAKKIQLYIKNERVAFILLLLIFLAGLSIFSYQKLLMPTQNNSSIPIDIQRWKVMADLPSSRSDIAIATDGDFIYVVGGKGRSGISGETDQYIPQSNEWVVKAKKPIPVFDAKAAFIGGKIFVPGGCIDTNRPIDNLEIYNPENNAWEKGDKLPIPLCAYGMTAFEGKLYLFGGWNGKEYVDSVFEYDPSKDQWMIRTPLSSPRAYLEAVVTKGRIYVIGGFDGKRALNNNDIYYPNLDNGHDNPWSDGIDLPEGRYSMGVASIGDIIHIIGGKSFGNTPLPSIELPPQSDAWQPIDPPTSSVWSSMGVAPISFTLFAVGGEENGEPVAKNLQYQVIYTILIPLVK